MAYLLDDDCIIFDIEQNPVISHAQTVAEVSLSQPLDVPSHPFSKRDIFRMICPATFFGRLRRFSTAKGVYST
jgi:hypothetical protein